MNESVNVIIVLVFFLILILYAWYLHCNERLKQSLIERLNPPQPQDFFEL